MRATILLLLASTASADCVYRVGSYQTRGPTHAHTFAVCARGELQLCISFMPCGKVRLFAGPCRGENWTLARTLAQARAIGATVRWGQPEVASDEFWEAFRRQVERLEAGAVLYIAIGERHHPGATNCIGAASVAILGYRLPTGLKYGHRASREIANAARHGKR